MRSRTRTATLAMAAALLAAAPLSGGFAGTDLFLPMVGRKAGVHPSNWYTTVWIHNPGASAATARIYFLPRGTANLSPPWVDVLVAGSDTEKLENVVETYFHVEAFGALRVTCATQKLIVTSRVYSKAVGADEEDSMGQDFAGVPASFAIGLGEKTQLLGVHRTLPDADSEFRYNFGCVETTGHTATVRVTAYDDNGALQGSTDVTVRAYSQGQWMFKDRFPGVSTENTRLEVEVIAGAGKVIAYGSGIASGSQDPTTFDMMYADSLLGIATVQHDATLTGDGTAAAPLGVADSGVGTPKLAADAVTADKILDGTVGTGDLANNAVTQAKLSPTGGAAGQVLGTDGTALQWQTDTLSLPFTNAPGQSAAGALLSITNTGGSTSVAIEGASASGTGLRATGKTGIWAEATGGNGVVGTTTSTASGVWGNATNGYGVSGSTSSTNAERAGVWGDNTGAGYGVKGTSTAGYGVYGEGGTDGVRGKTSFGDANGVTGWNAGGGDGVVGVTAGSLGAGVRGTNTGSGYGVKAESAAGTAIHATGFDFGVVATASVNGLSGTTGAASTLAPFPSGVIGSSLSYPGVVGLSDSSFGVAGTSKTFPGVSGYSTGSDGAGVWGESTAGYGVFGHTESSNLGRAGVWGSSTGVGAGVEGRNLTPSGVGVRGEGGDIGVFGYTSAAGHPGVYGTNDSTGGLGVEGQAGRGIGVRGSGSTQGVVGMSINGEGVSGTSDSGTGVYGSTAGSYGAAGVHGEGTGPHSTGVAGFAVEGAEKQAGYFSGNVTVTGMLTKGAGAFKIDHPLDPERKYLYHSFVESPDMLNIYNGNATLNAAGQAVIELPEWFEALNRDFRYQLTALGAPSPGLYVADEIASGRFKIAGGTPGARVSWQVTGIRNDAFARLHRIPVEEDKPAAEQGSYLDPGAFGQPEERGVDWARNPEVMRRMKEAQGTAVHQEPLPAEELGARSAAKE